MDIQAISTLVTTIGFPIAACIALFVQNAKQAEQHKEEIGKLTDALNNNTNVMSRLEVMLRDKEVS